MIIKDLTEQEIKQVGNFDVDVITHLKVFKNYQKDNDSTQEISKELGWFIHKMEQNILKYVDFVGGDQYSGGHWGMKHGFFCLENDNSLYVIESANGKTYKLNAQSFSVVVNMMVLNKMAMQAFEGGSHFDNQMAVFLSDHLKHLIRKNNKVFNVEDILEIVG